jgi:hypothetical protein
MPRRSSSSVDDIVRESEEKKIRKKNVLLELELATPMWVMESLPRWVSKCKPTWV